MIGISIQLFEIQFERVAPTQRGGCDVNAPGYNWDPMLRYWHSVILGCQSLGDVQNMLTEPIENIKGGLEMYVDM